MKSKDITFEYIEEFVDYIVNEVENDEDLFLTVVGKFEEIKNIIKEMIVIADVDFENIVLSCPEASDYTDEYVLDCWCNDGVIQIGCEPAKRDGKYLNLSGDETYLFNDCSSKIIPSCEGSRLYFVEIEDESDFNEGCDNNCLCDCCNEDKELSTTEKSHYSINGKSVSKEEFDKKYSEIQSKYEKNMKHMLDDYHSFMDDIDNMFNRLW